MKHLLIIFTLLLTSISWGKDVDSKDLVYRDGLFYEKFSDKPFTGKSTGKKQGKIKKGKREGKWSEYYDNGQLMERSNFKNGKRYGVQIIYAWNGNLFKKGNFIDGKKDGEHYYYVNGKLSSTQIYELGEKIKTIIHRPD
tara:strand:- start:21 stop:440 length:420 start_codon:yes stop_codon:yes gene_type:complete